MDKVAMQPHPPLEDTQLTLPLWPRHRLDTSDRPPSPSDQKRFTAVLCLPQNRDAACLELRNRNRSHDSILT